MLGDRGMAENAIVVDVFIIVNPPDYRKCIFKGFTNVKINTFFSTPTIVWGLQETLYQVLGF